MSDEQPEIKVHLLSKAESSAVNPRALEVEDEFQQFYAEAGLSGGSIGVLAPPYSPATLERLVQTNPSIGPCIDAMETNVDGTGYVIEPKRSDDGQEDPEASPDKLKAAQAFFDEVWPGLSFLELRKKLRRDLEATGNAYIEVLRNAKNDVVFLRHAPSRTMRLMRLDAPVSVPVTLMRGGQEVTVQTYVRERRFAQLISGKLVYFREFGASRQVNADTAAWETAESPVPFDKRGTEIIHLSLNPDAGGPYGVPRWEGQIPSVIGQRRAEEHNLDFFDSGGMPPILLIVGGGTASEPTRKALEQKFSPSRGSQHRAAILEVQSSSGSLDKAGGVDLKVERFGADQQKDAMFQSYDVACEKKIRRSFRLSGMFTGDYEGVSFATAYAAVLLAESQVFRPEREEFDAIITSRLLVALGFKGLAFRSKPLAVVDTATKMAGLQLALSTQRIDPAEVVTNVNEIAALNLKVVEAPEPPPGLPDPTKEGQGALEEPQEGQKAPKEPGGPQDPKPTPQGVSKFDQPGAVLALADDAMISLRRRDFQQLRKTILVVETLSRPQQDQFRSALAVRQYMDPGLDPEGTTLLAGCTVAALLHAGSSA